MLRNLLSASAVLCCFVPSLVAAQEAAGSVALEKADAIMGRIKAADSTILPALQAELSALAATEGLPAQCSATLVTIQSAAAVAVPVDTLDAMPAEMQEAVTAQSKALETRIAIEREACLKADAAQAEAPAVANEAVIETRAATAAELVVVRDLMKAAFDAKDSGALEYAQNKLTALDERHSHALQCRLASAGIAREGKGLQEILSAPDEEARKIAEASVKVSAIAVNSALKKCGE